MVVAVLGRHLSVLIAIVLREAHQRSQLPVMITETSAREDLAGRAQWMDKTLETIRALRVEGVPIMGYTWFPLFTMIEWKYRWSRRGLQDHLLHLGLYDVQPREGRMDREPTALVEAYRGHLADPAAAIGEWLPARPPTVPLVA